MENLLSKRLKNLGVIFLSAFILLFYLIYFYKTNLDSTSFEGVILSNFKSIENSIKGKILQFERRADYIYEKFYSKDLQHDELAQKEALIVEYQGVIKDYFGEIYYFKYHDIKPDDWLFIKRKAALFYLQKMADHVFYVRYFCEVDNNFILNQFKFKNVNKELKFYKGKKLQNKSRYIYDKSKDIFFYSHLLREANNQLEFYLKFSQGDIDSYFNKRRIFYLFIVTLFLLLFYVIYLRKRNFILSRILWFVFLLVLYLFIRDIGAVNLYLKVVRQITFYSIYEILILLIVITTLLFIWKNRLKIKIYSYLLFNGFMLISLSLCNIILMAVNYNYFEFTPNYLCTILVIFMLHLIPIFFLRGVTFEATVAKISYCVLLQSVVAACCYFLFPIGVINAILISLIALLMLFFKRKFLINIFIIFFLAVSIFLLINSHSIKEKKEFITNNLKNVFLNQNNYAKFIAREIVHELNLESENFHEFFLPDSSWRLQELWRKTMASRENIASGIFVLSPEGELVNHYAYQMHYLKVDPNIIFPFWAIEDAEADLYGKTSSLAIASINVVKKYQLLGRIIVQVLDSPELILRHHEKVNIFTIDNKINGKDLSYIKLNEKNQILENPSNINLQDVAGILQFNNQWIRFSFIDLNFNGYIFTHNNGNTYIIFFPANTIFKDLSEIIKIFVFLLILYFIFNFREMRNLEWKSIYYSFSLRVFSFLILISLLTAIIFSFFSINFNYQSASRQSRQMIYERGRTAQNIGNSLLEEESEFTRDHLQLLSRILNSDVGVYDKQGILLYSSNYRKIINNQVPDFLHSNTLDLLEQKNQKFVLIDDANGFHLYFKMSDYVLDIEFSYNWLKILSREKYYTNFIITLFFILIIIGFSSAFFFRNKILSPIEGLNHGMAEVEKGQLHKLKKLPKEIEIKNLYMGFNSMIEGIKEQRKNISEISRMKTIIKLGRRVAHEIKNPLTPIKLSAEQILKALKDKNPEYEKIIRQSINYIIDETEHLKRVSYGFLDLSRMEELSPTGFDLLELIKTEIFNFRQIYSHIDFSVYVEGNLERVNVKLDKIKIKQVIKNLINNSIEAIGEKKGEIRIKVKSTDARVLIEIVDSGIGMDKGSLDVIFNIDYSTKEIGTGLGLFIVKRIVELHKGNIEIISKRNEGTRVILDLPDQI
jgi:signal transduction histidine kinase